MSQAPLGFSKETTLSPPPPPSTTTTTTTTTTTKESLREKRDLPDEKCSPVPKKRAKLTKCDVDVSDAVPCCCICMSGITRRKLSSINCCSHEFCFDCIAEWSNTQNQCPLCKHRFERISRVHPSRRCSTTDPVHNVLDVPERNRLQARSTPGLSLSAANPFGTLDRDSLALAFHMFRQLAPSMGISQDAQERTIRRFEESLFNATRARDR